MTFPRLVMYWKALWWEKLPEAFLFISACSSRAVFPLWHPLFWPCITHLHHLSLLWAGLQTASPWRRAWSLLFGRNLPFSGPGEVWKYLVAFVKSFVICYFVTHLFGFPNSSAAHLCSPSCVEGEITFAPAVSDRGWYLYARWKSFLLSRDVSAQSVYLTWVRSCAGSVCLQMMLGQLSLGCAPRAAAAAAFLSAAAAAAAHPFSSGATVPTAGCCSWPAIPWA